MSEHESTDTRAGGKPRFYYQKVAAQLKAGWSARKEIAEIRRRQQAVPTAPEEFGRNSARIAELQPAVRQMNKTVAIIAVLALTLAWAVTQSGGARMDVVAQIGTGRALIARFAGVSSARAALQATLKQLAPAFDRMPGANRGFADQDDRMGGAWFEASQQGEPVAGFMWACVGPRGATVTVIHDRRAAAPQSFRQLAAAISGAAETGGGAAPARSAPMQQAAFPDGSGSVQLPADWQLVRASRGQGRAVGPRGQVAFLNIGLQVWTPEKAQQAQMFGGNYPFVAPYVPDPVQAFVNLAPALSQSEMQAGSPGFTVADVLGSERMDFQGYPAALVHLALDFQGHRHQALACVMCSPPAGYGAMDWVFTMTLVTTPEELAAQDFPAMLKILQTSQISSGEVGRRLSSAAETVRSIGDIIRRGEGGGGAGDNRQAPQDAFDETIRGWRTIEDAVTGTRRDVALGHSTEIVDELNKHYGPDRFREIPLGTN
ncbi:MAG TPA: hypothetical protein P5567_12970 [Kiritimatiellia bacterium]|nr:hypothetical protein [Kiritimatiellia bacterium]HRZ13354.1 hypothetical protein [Kiritimatiellia bacterium]HSA19006.1 hypothetical protein [Kiritimatiellia bacterium]